MQSVTVICDICKKDYSAKPLELQEFIHIKYTGGYGSVFGDGDTLVLDMCQHCLKQKLGEFVRIEGNNAFDRE